MAMATTAPPAFQPKLLRLDNDSFDVVAQVNGDISDLAVSLCDHRTSALCTVQTSVRAIVPKLVESKHKLNQSAHTVEDAVFGADYCLSAIRGASGLTAFESILANIEKQAQVARSIHAAYAQQQQQLIQQRKAARHTPPPPAPVVRPVPTQSVANPVPPAQETQPLAEAEAIPAKNTDAQSSDVQPEEKKEPAGKCELEYFVDSEDVAAVPDSVTEETSTPTKSHFRSPLKSGAKRGGKAPDLLKPKQFS